MGRGRGEERRVGGEGRRWSEREGGGKVEEGKKGKRRSSKYE